MHWKPEPGSQPYREVDQRFQPELSDPKASADLTALAVILLSLCLRLGCPVLEDPRELCKRSHNCNEAEDSAVVYETTRVYLPQP